MQNSFGRYRRIIVVGTDIAAFAAAYALAFALRFDFHLPPSEWVNFYETILLIIGCRMSIFTHLGAYEGLWRYASIADLLVLIKAIATSQVLIVAAVLFIKHANFPRSVLIMDPILALGLVSMSRFIIRLTREWRYNGNTSDLPRLLIYGAGDLGETTARDLQRRDPKTFSLIGFADDDPSKLNHRIHGLPILGGRNDLPRLIEEHRVDEVVIAVNHARGKLIKELIDICMHVRGRRIQFKTLPTIEQTLHPQSSTQVGLRKIDLSDLLPRRSVRTDLNAVKSLIAGKTVLVTGAGGTIGSELSRQILSLNPSKLILLEHNNTALFQIDRELAGNRASRIHIPLSGDVGDPVILENLFATHRPELVFHAAAHKHVPLMESNVQEAISNNTVNTHLLAETALRHGVQCFLYISTDKAVRPTSVMGVSKRLGEMVIRALSAARKTKFLSVRFGNVLGSSGSAITIFREQIDAGGPITVTHPDVTRYFMTTEEAVQLILQACALGRGGEIFVLNMGEPVKVLDIARNLILLSGLEPDKDIRIVFTGLRPGEKMFEELFRPHDVRMDTGHPDIFAAVPEEADRAIMNDQIAELKRLSTLPEAEPLLAKLRQLVPSYHPSAQPQTFHS